MKRSALLLSALATVVSLGVTGERSASACGGTFIPPPPPGEETTTSDITDERVLLTVSPQQTTLYDQIEYTGNPASFAWVLPIHGTVAVALSADVLFDSVDALTATAVSSPVASCPSPTCTVQGQGFADSTGGGGCNATESEPPAAAPASAFEGAAAGPPATPPPPPVTVTKQDTVGPYATVQLSSTNPTALEEWLMANGYQIPAAVQPIIAAYVSEGFDFLAMKLLPGEGVQAMRPVRVSTNGASLSLPLRMASVGTAASVGFTIWVVSDGRYEPSNYPFFHIDDAQIVWDWSSQSSNYTTLRQQEEASYKGKGWELESAISLSQETVVQAVETSGASVTGGGTFPASVDASMDYLPVTDANGNVTTTADQVRTADLTALFAGLAGPNATITRMRSDIAQSAMTADFVVRASADQSLLSNLRYPTHYVNLPCPTYDPSTCQVTGTTLKSASIGLPVGGPSPSESRPTSAAACSASHSREPPLSLTALATMAALVAMRPRRRREVGAAASTKRAGLDCP